MWVTLSSCFLGVLETEFLANGPAEPLVEVATETQELEGQYSQHLPYQEFLNILTDYAAILTKASKPSEARRIKGIIANFADNH